MNTRHSYACASSLWHTAGTRRIAACIVVLTALGSNMALAAPTVAGNTISWPADGWYQVQNAATYQSVCQGGRSCSVPAGKYIVINHSIGKRFENIIVADDGPELPLDDNPDVLPEPQVPVLADPYALPLPLPNPKDPFGSFLEADNEPAVVGGPLLLVLPLCR